MCVSVGGCIRIVRVGGCVWISSFRGSMLCYVIMYICFSVRGG